MFGTPDDFAFEGMKEDINYGMSHGLMAWRAIAFALSRGLELPDWVRQYLEETAAGIDDWGLHNGHPSALKDILCLSGKRKFENDQTDPRWVYHAVCQMREQKPDATVKALVVACMKKFPLVGGDEETVRQKYYQGKRLAEKGKDYKRRGRKRELWSEPNIAHADDTDGLDF